MHKQRLVGPQIRLVEVRQHVADLGVVGADDHAVGLHEVVDGRPFLEELGVVRHAAVAGPVSWRSRAATAALVPTGTVLLSTTMASSRQVRGQIVHDRPEGRKIDRAVVGRRRAHGQEDDLGLRGGGRQVGGEVQQSGGGVPRNQFRQARFVDRHLAPQQPLDLPRVAIDAGHVVARLGQAGARDQSHVARSDNCKFHDCVLSSFLCSAFFRFRRLPWARASRPPRYRLRRGS